MREGAAALPCRAKSSSRKLDGFPLAMLPDQDRAPHHAESFLDFRKALPLAVKKPSEPARALPGRPRPSLQSLRKR